MQWIYSITCDKTVNTNININCLADKIKPPELIDRWTQTWSPNMTSMTKKRNLSFPYCTKLLNFISTLRDRNKKYSKEIMTTFTSWVKELRVWSQNIISFLTSKSRQLRQKSDHFSTSILHIFLSAFISRPFFRASPRARGSLFCCRALWFCWLWARLALSELKPWFELKWIGRFS